MTNIVQMRGEAKLAWIIPSAAYIIKNVKTKKIIFDGGTMKLMNTSL